MVYERIEKPNYLSAGISPSKLRAILLGLKRKEEKEKEEEGEEEESDGFGFRFPVRSESDGPGDTRFNAQKDSQECTSSVEFVGGFRPRDHNLVNPNSKFRSTQEEDPFDQEPNFEFHRLSERAPLRSPLMLPFSKAAPSKWDDAEKWIASPTSSRTGKGVGGVGQSKKSGLGGNGNRQMGTKVVLEVMDEPDTKRIDTNQARKEIGGQRDQNMVVPLSAKHDSVLEKLVADSPTSLSRHDLPNSIHSSTTHVSPPTTTKSVSMRDMGTEMTPLASHEPSRTGTPVRAASPTYSPTFSRPLSPTEPEENSSVIVSADFTGDSDKKLSEEEFRMKTRRDIMALGQQLGKMNIAAWAGKEEQEAVASASSLNAVSVDQPASSTEARAAAWEEAEKAKYLARFKQEEVKIQAWENHQKAKTEAEMRKIEVEVERMRARANDKLMSKLACAKHKAEEKRAAAEARKNRQAAKTAEQVEYIRRTGRVPSSSSCWSWFI
ncbi:uncharacterized protein M6B38_311045 [Iris pallida]|uniref:Remorin C-terminal domain-containing protein n=1 Tax=Iris pallida TaxID=29817 RepID=A0AAX6HH61_IRIPA|nr:uncharacterized protein M6B38_311045 [Iris pallida]